LSKLSWRTCIKVCHMKFRQMGRRV
jgi:hypothetical protein